MGKIKMSRSCQFASAMNHQDTSNVVFGQVVYGMNVVQVIENTGRVHTYQTFDHC